MSELYLPPHVRRRVAAERAQAQRRAAQDAATDFEPYYSELPKIKEVTEKLNRIFAWAGEEAWTERQFETSARNLYGDAGFEISLEWLQAMDPETGSELPLKVPNITITGRVKKERERDHDRLKHEIVTGQADGQAGYIREDGSRREDPIKKTIV
jgi:hypothetical protein